MPERASVLPMEKRPLLSRFKRLPTYVWRAMKEAHAVIYALIASVTWFFGNYLVPWAFQRCGVPVPTLGLPIISCVSIIILLLVLGIGGYLVWENEEYEHRELRERIAPKLDIKFEPPRPGFFFWARKDGVKSLYVRVLPKPRMPLTKCKGFLESIERLEGDKWVSVGFASRPQLHWSEVHERGSAEVDLFTDNDSQFLDVAFVRQTDNSVRLAIDQNPSWLVPLLASYPQGIFKLAIAIMGTAGDEIVEAKIALRFLQGDQWGLPVVTRLL